MDPVQKCLSLCPVAELKSLWFMFSSMTSSLETLEASKEQVTVIVRAAAQILISLDGEYRSSALRPEATAEALHGLYLLLETISAFIQRQCSQNFFRALTSREKRLSTLASYEVLIEIHSKSFQSPNVFPLPGLKALSDAAKRTDQGKQHALLRQMEGSRLLLEERLDLIHENPNAMCVTLQRRLSDGLGDQEELRFFLHCVQYLRTLNGIRADLDHWTLTVYDVEFGSNIASGACQVYHGHFGAKEIALKVLKSPYNISPQVSVVRRQIYDWRKLDHPHILKFLGANLSDDYLFIVTPYMKDSNVMDHIKYNQNCNRVKMLQQVCLGLTYLHSQNVVHGAIKGSNVLIDPLGNAVLCDFGLTSIKADMKSRTPANATSSPTNRNWMAPELFTGAPLSKACDIYSLGMTMYEVFTNEIPFGHIPVDELRPLITHNGRPSRPSTADAPQLSDEVWKVIGNCWHKSVSRRPSSDSVAETLTLILASNCASSATLSLDGSDMPAIYDTANFRSSPSVARFFDPFVDIFDDLSDKFMINSRGTPYSLPRIHDFTKIIISSKSYERCLTLPNLEPVSCLCLSPTGRTLLVGQADGRIDVWNAVKGIHQTRCPPATSNSCSITSLAFAGSTDNQFISGSSNGDVFLWQKAISEYKHDMYSDSCEGPTPVRCISVSRWQSRVSVFTGDSNHTIKCWLNGPGKPSDSRSLVSIQSTSTCATFTPSGSQLLMGDSDGTLSLWEEDSGQPSRRPLPYCPPPPPPPSERPVGDRNSIPSQGCQCISIACSPDGKRVLVGYSNNEIRLWDISSGTYVLVRPPSTPCHSLPIAFSQDGSFILYPSSNQRKCIDICDLKSNTVFMSCELQEWPEGASVHSIIVSPDKSRLFLSFHDHKIVLVFCFPAPQRPSISAIFIRVVSLARNVLHVILDILSVLFFRSFSVVFQLLRDLGMLNIRPYYRGVVALARQWPYFMALLLVSGLVYSCYRFTTALLRGSVYYLSLLFLLVFIHKLLVV